MDEHPARHTNACAQESSQYIPPAHHPGDPQQGVLHRARAHARAVASLWLALSEDALPRLAILETSNHALHAAYPLRRHFAHDSIRHKQGSKSRSAHLMATVGQRTRFTSTKALLSQSETFLVHQICTETVVQLFAQCGQQFPQSPGYQRSPRYFSPGSDRLRRLQLRNTGRPATTFSYPRYAGHVILPQAGNDPHGIYLVGHALPHLHAAL